MGNKKQNPLSDQGMGQMEEGNKEMKENMEVSMKQRSLRKMVSMILAVVMVLAMSITGFAATESAGSGGGSITITNAVNGETYTVYKMLDLTYNSTTGSYSYKIVSGWEDFFTTTNGYTVSNGYVTASSGDIATLAKTALEYARNNEIAATKSVTADADGASITGLDLGYYLVDTTLGTLCSINSAVASVEIEEKNYIAVVPDKQVKENDDSTYSENNTAGIGEVVDYKVTVNNAANKSNVTVVDTLSKGLTLNTNQTDDPVVNITVNGNNVPETNYTVTATMNESTGETTLTIVFTDAYLATLSDTSVITITYSATVNESAVVGETGNGNDVFVNYGNSQSIEKTTKTYTYGFELCKYTTVNGEKTNLSGAKFTLADSNGTISFVEVKDASNIVTGYRVATSTDTNTGTTIEAGSVTISGLDAGNYTLTEIEAPDGYNKLGSSISVEIDENGSVTMNGENVDSVEVENETGSSLPSTGGIGTTIFYIVGGVLVLGAAVLFVTKRRLSNED